eukprot:Partr_v1_DN25698_c0_g1_i1_m4903 putative Halo-acid dehalogenase-like hydrolase
MITHCIFDMDGLLLDTERIYSLVTETIVAEWGKTYPWELKSKMMGQREMEAAHLLVTSLDLPITPEEYLIRRNRMQNELFASARPLPGVERLIRHLHAHKIPIAVATSSHRAGFELKTSENKDLFKLFNTVVTGDDPAVVRGKPHPDIFQEAAKRLKAENPGTCLVFEDAPAGVRAGKSASMKVCWVPDAQLDRQGLEADLILESLEHFDPAHWGLPAFV